MRDYGEVRKVKKQVRGADFLTWPVYARHEASYCGAVPCRTPNQEGQGNTMAWFLFLFMRRSLGLGCVRVRCPGGWRPEISWRLKLLSDLYCSCTRSSRLTNNTMRSNPFTYGTEEAVLRLTGLHPEQERCGESLGGGGPGRRRSAAENDMKNALWHNLQTKSDCFYFIFVA